MIVSAVAAAAPAAAVSSPISCTYGDLTRKIEVVYQVPGHPVPCEVIYDKSAEGRIETLWRAGSEAGYCEAKAAGLAEKLERSGWQCAADRSTGESADG